MENVQDDQEKKPDDIFGYGEPNTDQRFKKIFGNHNWRPGEDDRTNTF